MLEVYNVCVAVLVGALVAAVIYARFATTSASSQDDGGDVVDGGEATFLAASLDLARVASGITQVVAVNAARVPKGAVPFYGHGAWDAAQPAAFVFNRALQARRDRDNNDNTPRSLLRAVATRAAPGSKLVFVDALPGDAAAALRAHGLTVDSATRGAGGLVRAVATKPSTPLTAASAVAANAAAAARQRDAEAEDFDEPPPSPAITTVGSPVRASFTGGRKSFARLAVEQAAAAAARAADGAAQDQAQAATPTEQAAAHAAGGLLSAFNDASRAGFAQGERVEVHWEGDDRWFAGRVAGVNGDGSLAVAYDDGDADARVDPSIVRRAGSAAAGPPPVAADPAAAKESAAAAVSPGFDDGAFERRAAEIDALMADERPFLAAEALDALEADLAAGGGAAAAPLREACASGARFAAVREARAEIGELARQFASCDGWQKRSNWKRVMVSTKRYDAQNAVAIKCSGICEDVPMFNVAALIYEQDLMGTWIPNVKNCRRTFVPGKRFRAVSSMEFPLPFPFKNRESSLIGYGAVYEGKAVVVHCRSTTEAEEAEGGRFHGLAPPRVLPRTDVHWGGFYICKATDIPASVQFDPKLLDKCKDPSKATFVQSIWLLNLQIPLMPEWMLVMVSKWLVAQLIVLLREKGREKAFAKMPHQQRLKDTPEIYDEIRRRLRSITD